MHGHVGGRVPDSFINYYNKGSGCKKKNQDQLSQ